MIESLRIRGLGVIADVELRLHPGLTVLTGETGAGKTMVLTGLGLVLGERSDPARVRPGAARAVAEGVVVLPAGSPARDAVTGAGGVVDDDGTVVLVRTVSAEGRSRAHAGGTAVPAVTLVGVGGELVTVHGQADQRRLVHRSVQRDLLDAYASRVTDGVHGRLLADHGRVYGRLAEVDARLAALVAASAERAREQDMLRHGLAEIAEVGPKPGEDVELTVEQSRLGHAADLTTAARTAHDVLTGEDLGAGGSVAGALAVATRALDDVAGLDPALSELAGRLRALLLEVGDTATDLASYAGSVEDDPVRLAMIGDRRAALSRLDRRYGTAAHSRAPASPAGASPAPAADGADPVLAWAADAERRLLDLDGAGDELAVLRADRDGLVRELAGTAVELSASRRRSGADLAAAVTVELADLAMPSARLSVQVIPRTAVAPADPDGLTGRPVGVGVSGADDVVLGLEPHPGAGVAPLGQGVSGGELSRVMLALEVVLAGTTGTPTYVFDEVDAGIGGRTALEVGRRLARLAATRQVVVVTHLAQVAAFADRHLVVVKDAAGEVTSSGVTEVSDGDRVAELARMLAGNGDSAAARAHAAELLVTAQAGVPAG